MLYPLPAPPGFFLFFLSYIFYYHEQTRVPRYYGTQFQTARKYSETTSTSPLQLIKTSPQTTNNTRDTMKLMSNFFPRLRRSSNNDSNKKRKRSGCLRRQVSVSSFDSLMSDSLDSENVSTVPLHEVQKARKSVRFTEARDVVYEYPKVSRSESGDVWFTHIELFWFRREFGHMVQEMRNCQSNTESEINPLQRTYLAFCQASSLEDALHTVYSTEVYISATTLGTERCMLGDFERKQRRLDLVHSVVAAYRESTDMERVRSASRSHTRAAVLFAYFVAERAVRARCWIELSHQKDAFCYYR